MQPAEKNFSPAACILYRRNLFGGSGFSGGSFGGRGLGSGLFGGIVAAHAAALITHIADVL